MRGMMVGALLGALFSFAGVPPLPVRAQQAENQAVVHIDTATDFQTVVLQSKQPVLVDFYSNACAPCRKLAPVMNQLASEFDGRAVVAKVNVNRLPELATQHRIQSIPAVLFYEHGKESQRVIGYHDRAVYTKQLEMMTSATHRPAS
jgi:thioredoxin 1